MNLNRWLLLVVLSAGLLTIPSSQVLAALMRAPHQPRRAGRSPRRARRSSSLTKAISGNERHAQDLSREKSDAGSQVSDISGLEHSSSPPQKLRPRLSTETAVFADAPLGHRSRYLLFCCLTI